MALKYNKSRSSGKKTYVRVNYKKQLTTKKPLKSLTSWNHNVSGRNFQGKITIRHHGGGHKQKLREIDFKRNKDNIMATIKTIEYNPNRSSFISLYFLRLYFINKFIKSKLWFFRLSLSKLFFSA